MLATRLSLVYSKTRHLNSSFNGNNSRILETFPPALGKSVTPAHVTFLALGTKFHYQFFRLSALCTPPRWPNSSRKLDSSSQRPLGKIAVSLVCRHEIPVLGNDNIYANEKSDESGSSDGKPLIFFSRTAPYFIKGMKKSWNKCGCARRKIAFDSGIF
jgi:hypothetical protein